VDVVPLVRRGVWVGEEMDDGDGEVGGDGRTGEKEEEEE
jgi:hypothetical protein